ncbi:MAG TPA: prolyl aminopeptidase [Candidatus Dependentiae bacterium]|nr:prolyl aminopeptidase [Candidatus Dependentiae bacterium]HRQ62887.1 prolyl aminopeptidase [Candidatus Dependentiae bacterium]
MSMFIFLLLFSPVFSSICDIQNFSFETDTCYTTIKPYYEDYLQVSPYHRIFYAEYGNPNGIPVVVVHGGPGYGCIDSCSKFFDPSYFHIIMFDQRGALKSIPCADMYDNTPQASVHDMELLREHLNIDKWILFGGSYGSLLSILYGETHPDRVLYFVLRGIFLGRKQDYEHLFYGMNKFFPESYQSMLNLLSAEEQSDLITSLHKRIMNSDSSISQPIADAFMYYDGLCSVLNPDFDDKGDQIVDLSVARAFIHYAAHHFFLEENQLLNNIEKIKHLPAIIVHGRYDLICPPQNAYDLYNVWPNTELWFIENAGHSSEEKILASALTTAMNTLKGIFI